MLSLPLLAPQNEYSFFLSPHLRPQSTNDASNGPDSNVAQQSRRQTSQQTSAPTRQSLAQLLADEQAISHRKHNIRRFGAGWIKPPGVAKTLQAETEERAEREEQEALQRREQMMMDMQAQQEAEEARNRAAAAEEQAEGEEEQERDLDEEIPDADGEEEEEDDDEVITDSDEEEDEDDEEEPEEMQSELQSEMLSQMHSEIPVAEDITFNEESMFADTSMAALDEESREQERYRHLQEAELTGVAQDELDLGIERDLDDSVPEAGSYQHTDSELEDSDSDDDEDEEEEEQSQLEPQEGEQSEIMGAVMQHHSRSSLLSRDVSSLLDSSFITSSPAPIGRLRSAGHRPNQR
ncbi:hypothetical protein QM012_002892 [Aureobasidium pullulans]|uniref:Apc15p protein-domain-containing protein n=1 Tax=Aureobasidium pullulans TaxID=5580 RepID=A0ABR0TAU2_AURPU